MNLYEISEKIYIIGYMFRSIRHTHIPQHYAQKLIPIDPNVVLGGI